DDAGVEVDHVGGKSHGALVGPERLQHARRQVGAVRLLAAVDALVVSHRGVAAPLAFDQEGAGVVAVLLVLILRGWRHGYGLAEERKARVAEVVVTQRARAWADLVGEAYVLDLLVAVGAVGIVAEGQGRAWARRRKVQLVAESEHGAAAPLVG